MIFDNPIDLHARTRDSFCKIAGEVCYVREVDGDYMFLLKENNEELERLRYIVGETNILPPVLGFADTGMHGPIYLSRNPRRAWKVGLTQANCVNRFLFENYEKRDICRFLNQIENNTYDSPERTVEEVVNNNSIGKALSRKYAFTRTGLLWRGSNLGSFNFFNKILTLESNRDMEFHIRTLRDINSTIGVEVKTRVDMKYYHNDFDV